MWLYWDKKDVTCFLFLSLGISMSLWYVSLVSYFASMVPDLSLAFVLSMNLVSLKSIPPFLKIVVMLAAICMKVSYVCLDPIPSWSETWYPQVIFLILCFCLQTVHLGCLFLVLPSWDAHIVYISNYSRSYSGKYRL